MFFAFEVFFRLALDELTLEHFLLDFLDVSEFEVLQLVADFLRVVLFHFVFFFQLGAHLLVVFLHLLDLNFLPVLLNLLFLHQFACF